MMQFATAWIDLEIVILSEVSQRKENVMKSLLCGIKKNDTNEFTYKIETDSQTSRTNL